MNSKGILFIVSGFAGTGKSTITQGLIKKYDSYELSISATTRNPRGSERDGVEYFFVSREKFETMISDNMFLEYANYVGNYYGTPKEWVNRKLDEGKNVILEIEMQGALKVKQNNPDALLIFLLPPDIKELERRILSRGTESEFQVKKRLSRAKEEVEYIKKYDYILINEDIEKSIEIVHNIVQSEKLSVERNFENIDQYIKEFLK